MHHFESFFCQTQSGAGEECANWKSVGQCHVLQDQHREVYNVEVWMLSCPTGKIAFNGDIWCDMRYIGGPSFVLGS